MVHFSDFTNEYAVAKTLRAGLIPMGDTLNNLQKIINEDSVRKESYIKVKKLIDEYHKYHIENSLSNFSFYDEVRDKSDYLSNFYRLYLIKNKTDKEKEEYEKCQNELRKIIVNILTTNDAYKRIDKKELITKDLPSFIDGDDNKELVKDFSNFTTYFTGFHTNRKNMYSAEPISTAIAFRIIHQNLPKFIDNIKIFDELKNSELQEVLTSIYLDYKEYLNVNSLEDIFKINYYNNVLTQKQIDIYNLIIGGKSDEKIKIKGLNEYINLYNQKQNDKSKKIPLFNMLFKQILSDRNIISWLPDEFDDDNTLLSSIREFYIELEGTIFNTNSSNNISITDLFNKIEDYDLSGIYIKNDTQLTDISNKIFGDWSMIKEALISSLKNYIIMKPKECEEKYNERINKVFSSIKSYSIQYINNAIRDINKGENIESYFKNLLCNDNCDINLIKTITNKYKNAEKLLNSEYPKEQKLIQDDNNINLIKDLLDSIKSLELFIKPLLGNGDEPNKDNIFYGELSKIWEKLNKITPLYNMVRNYVTKKPYSTEKIKLNFENSTLLDGWDLNKEKDNSGILLRKDGLYYLGIINKHHNKIFDIENIISEGECYEKMEYKLLPGPNKMLPKVFFSKSRISEFNPSEEIITNYNKETHKKGNNFNLNDCHNLINFFKTSINKHEDWSKFNFKFSDTKDYEDLSGFYREVEQQGYKISFRNISATYINELVKEGKLYLFKIYNKDFSEYSKGNPNLHTIYWKMLFDENNLKDTVYKLNGGGEVFYRKSSIKYEKPTHEAHIPIKNKTKNYHKESSVFEYDLIKDKRYTMDKFFLHIPITINFKAIGNNNLNQKSREYIKRTKDIHIIGIDRGERHLIYISVINMQGEIIEQFSLNTINNFNYHDLLEEKADERKKNRQSWKTIGKIKDIKEGYLSQVIHKISELMIRYNAIVVLEDLNIGFKRGRQKVEKEVYQKFEKMLIDKLNCLVFKNRDINDTGGALKPYQLTNQFTSFEKLGKQSGFLFYVPAWNTSKMDPETGFVNLFGKHINYENIEQTKKIINKFNYIKYNTDKNLFEFNFNYNDFTDKANDSKGEWSIFSYGNRIETFRNPVKKSEWDNREIELTTEFKNLFSEFNIDINNNLKESILSQDKKEFFEKLLYLIRLTLQMRNSIIGSDIDYLVSPVMNSNGEFYDSRICKNMPNNADANGAYNIARKGLWIVKQIKNSSNTNEVKLAITNKEWLKFIQYKQY